MENRVSPACFPGKSPRGWVWFFFILEPCRSKLKDFKAFLLGDIGVGIPPHFNSVFSRVLFAVGFALPPWRRMKFSPRRLCCRCTRGIAGVGRDQKARLGLQRGEVGGVIRSGASQAAREGRAQKEKSNRGGKSRADFVGKAEPSLGEVFQPPLASSGVIQALFG